MNGLQKSKPGIWGQTLGQQRRGPGSTGYLPKDSEQASYLRKVGVVGALEHRRTGTSSAANPRLPLSSFDVHEGEDRVRFWQTMRAADRPTPGRHARRVAASDLVRRAPPSCGATRWPATRKRSALSGV